MFNSSLFLSFSSFPSFLNIFFLPSILFLASLSFSLFWFSSLRLFIFFFLSLLFLSFFFSLSPSIGIQSIELSELMQATIVGHVVPGAVM